MMTIFGARPKPS